VTQNEEEKEEIIKAAQLTASLSVRNGGQFVKEVIEHWMGQSDMHADWEPFMAASQDKQRPPVKRQQIQVLKCFHKECWKRK